MSGTGSGSGSGSNAAAVSAATPLYPFDLAYDLTPGQLAQKAELASCFLCTQLNMSAEAAAIWAKQLCAVAVVTVNDFLRLTHAQCEAQKLSPASVMRLDECLQQFAGLPENRHAALEGKAESEGSVAQATFRQWVVVYRCPLPVARPSLSRSLPRSLCRKLTKFLREHACQVEPPAQGYTAVVGAAAMEP